MHIQFELLDRTPVIPQMHRRFEIDPSLRSPVRFKNMGFEYPNRPGVQFLDEFNRLEIGAGESAALV